MGDELEQRLGGPQDIEWAMQDGEIFVLQARPVTA
jgi:pyruvate,water dikinase